MRALRTSRAKGKHHPNERQQKTSSKIVCARTVCSAQNIWKARCVGQWKVPPTASCAWRALHVDLVHCLSLVDGTADSCGGCYDNVLAIVDVLDAYRTLGEMNRACFGRLGELLDSDEAREAVKVVDWRIMDHALWALNTYPDDVDLLLVSTPSAHKFVACGHAVRTPSSTFVHQTLGKVCSSSSSCVVQQR